MKRFLEINKKLDSIVRPRHNHTTKIFRYHVSQALYTMLNRVIELSLKKICITLLKKKFTNNNLALPLNVVNIIEWNTGNLIS